MDWVMKLVPLSIAIIGSQMADNLVEDLTTRGLPEGKSAVGSYGVRFGAGIAGSLAGAIASMVLISQVKIVIQTVRDVELPVKDSLTVEEVPETI